MPNLIPLALAPRNSGKCNNYDEDESYSTTPSPIQQGYMNNQYLKGGEDQVQADKLSIVKLPKSNKIYDLSNIPNVNCSEIVTDKALTGESSYDQKCCIIM